jgi:hypothetical protein
MGFVGPQLVTDVDVLPKLPPGKTRSIHIGDTLAGGRTHTPRFSAAPLCFQRAQS